MFVVVNSVDGKGSGQGILFTGHSHFYGELNPHYTIGSTKEKDETKVLHLVPGQVIKTSAFLQDGIIYMNKDTEELGIVTSLDDATRLMKEYQE